MEASLKEIRKSIGYTQSQAAEYLKISARSYKAYENEPSKVGTIKYEYMVDKLSALNFVDENHGILTIDEIRKKSAEIFDSYDIRFGYLFGSYAKGKAKEDSDIDLVISPTVTGLKFYGLVEKLSSSLKKRIDLLDTNQLVNNVELLNEILEDGIKIYG